MAEEPSLPFLPFGSASNAFLERARPGKRVRLHSTSPPISSDPPLFSSDDDPSAENYADPTGRQKRRYRGPWYKQEPVNAIFQPTGRREKRKLERHFDSAVWLGSDGTDEDADCDFLSNAETPHFLAKSLYVGMRPSPLRSRIMAPKESISPEEMARQQIEDCLENGKEDIDLSARGLTSLSNATIRPLASFSSMPTFSQGASYQNLLPTLRIYLASNQLKDVPGEIFNLEHLNVLSLRNNELEQLPAAIARLHCLTELNVSNNAFRWLPYELLDLLSCPSNLKILHLHPNPFYEPYASDEDTRSLSLSPNPLVEDPGSKRIRDTTCCVDSQHDHSTKAEWKARFKCRSHVRFLDIDGTLLQGPQLTKGPDGSTLRLSNLPGCSRPRATRGRDIQVAPPDDIPKAPTTWPSSLAPSLVELCVKSWAKTPNMPNLHEYYDGRHPEKLSSLLEGARTLREAEATERKCTTCKRSFVIPRTEWIEWWEIERATSREQNGIAAVRTAANRRDVIESMVPLMRRGCSWRCLPER